MKYIRSFLLLVLNFVFLLCEQVSYGVTVKTENDKKIIIDIESLTTPLPPQIAYYVSNKYRDMNVTPLRMGILEKQTYIPYDYRRNHNYDRLTDSMVASQKSHRVVVMPDGRRVKYVKRRKHPYYKRYRPSTYIRPKSTIRKIRSSKEYLKRRRHKDDIDWYQPEDEDLPVKISTNRLRAKHKQLFHKEGKYPYNIEPDETSESEEEDESQYGKYIPRKKIKTWKSTGKYATIKKKNNRRPAPGLPKKKVVYYPNYKKPKTRLGHEFVLQRKRPKYTKYRKGSRSRYPSSTKAAPDPIQQHTPYLPNVHDFIIYLTKLNESQYKKEPKDDENEGYMSEQKERFVPSHFLFTVRKSESKQQKPTKPNKPNIKEKLSESGGHTVYTEDGYRDKEYDHAYKDLGGSFNADKMKRRLTRSLHITPFFSKLKGNASKIKKTNYSLMKKITKKSSLKKPKNNRYTKAGVSRRYLRNSPISYIESSNHHGNIKSPMYFYKTKEDSFNCARPETIKFVTTPDQKIVSTSTSQSQRLSGLGEKIVCFRNKFFGSNPLNNKIFNEEFVNDRNKEFKPL